ncbi:DegT/DnrJ/EryC1/StrS family aminotransferase [Psychrobacter frigidicola]|uniref:DegT/DnrJ/EryC1/StrS family aminotransferase n=1 Tax=Psychrobacter frigidicola TaxID=45611 RepID=UPI0023EE389F|nr:DegT/DnrJ/EryC1/StrS family aminotransferase [Psychrobacter frigidicola]
MGAEEIAEVVDSLRSGWITTGPKVKRFEEEFAEYIESDVQALAMNSATSGLHLGLEAVGVKAGDEVIIPSYTFTATAEVVRYLGATPVFVDSDPVTLNIDPKAIEAAITIKTKAIIPVHFAGLACDMDAIIAMARKYKLKVVEDAAHAFPTRYKGNLVGTLDTDVTIYSFYANKTMATAEGGMLVSRDPNIIERCKIMRLHGISRDAFDRYSSKRPSWYYEIVEPGFKYNMPDICASIGIHQLKKINIFHKKRTEMAQVYDEAFKSLPLTLPARSLGIVEHAWHLYAIRLNDEVTLSRDDFIMKMSDYNIGCSVHFIPLHLQPVWRDGYALTPEQFPHAEAAYQRIVSIPLYTKMTIDDQLRVISAVNKTLDHA